MSTREERFARIDRDVFRTITGADWARELAAARRTENSVSAQIRQKILDLNLGNRESEMNRRKGIL